MTGTMTGLKKGLRMLLIVAVMTIFGAALSEAAAVKADTKAASAALNRPSAKVKALKIKEVEYEGNGRVEVSFAGKVQYNNVKVSVKSTGGKTYSATVVKKDNDDLTFRINGYKKGVTYRFTISGIRARGAAAYTSISGSIRIAGASEVLIESVEYDARDREVEFEFQGRVSWRKPTVKITQGNTNYVRWIEEKDKDSIEVKVKKLVPGQKYQYRITGVSKYGMNQFTTVTGTFVA